MLVFLGASYFRAVGKDSTTGCRRAGWPSTPPRRPARSSRTSASSGSRGRADANSMVIYALLDPAHDRRISLRGDPGRRDGDAGGGAALLPRASAKLGIAPLTSMFAFGENQPGRDDYRPEVHDSDGLSIQRQRRVDLAPARQPERLLVTSFTPTDPRGFGLMQRDRAPTSYQDPEALYDRRPSAWVEPRAPGGGPRRAGGDPDRRRGERQHRAYWIPAQAAAPGKPVEIGYRMRWQVGGPVGSGKGWVVQSRRGRGYVRLPDGDINFVVDFDGPALRALGAGEAWSRWSRSTGTPRCANGICSATRSAALWRMTVRITRADATKPVEMRAFPSSNRTQAHQRNLELHRAGRTGEADKP